MSGRVLTASITRSNRNKALPTCTIPENRDSMSSAASQQSISGNSMSFFSNLTSTTEGSASHELVDLPSSHLRRRLFSVNEASLSKIEEDDAHEETDNDQACWFDKELSQIWDIFSD